MMETIIDAVELEPEELLISLDSKGPLFCYSSAVIFEFYVKSETISIGSSRSKDKHLLDIIFVFCKYNELIQK